MALYKITVKKQMLTNQGMLEPGMSVQVSNKLLSVLLICAFVASSAFGQRNEDVREAQLSNNIERLIELSNSQGDIATEAQKALLTTVSYSEITNYQIAMQYYDKAKNTPAIEPVFKEYMEKYKQTELLNIKGMNVGELTKYMSMSNEKNSLAKYAIINTILQHRNQLTLDNLNYLCAELPLYTYEFNAERKTRVKESQELLRTHVKQYTIEESKFMKNFCYIIERSAYDYLYESYGYIAEAYSKISKLPENEDDIEKQFNMIVQTVFSSDKYRSYLQNEINNFCAQVNKQRALYAKTAGVNKFTKLSLKVPNISFDNYSADRKAINKIITEIEDNKTYNGVANTVSTIGSFIPGWRWVIKAGAFLAKVYLSSSLVENIMEARKEYMQDVLVALEQKIMDETQAVEDQLYKQMIDNESKYIQDVQK
ncbi:MAG: hypothetical protein J6T70_01490 [Bacteroidales bacterium]|nr:hypothetical protein [Bacteroidales bacterium]